MCTRANGWDGPEQLPPMWPPRCRRVADADLETSAVAAERSAVIPAVRRLHHQCTPRLCCTRETWERAPCPLPDPARRPHLCRLDAFSGKTAESHEGGIWRALVTLGGLRLPKSGFGPGTMLRCAGKSDSPPVSVVLICRPRRSQAQHDKILQPTRQHPIRRPRPPPWYRSFRTGQDSSPVPWRHPVEPPNTSDQLPTSCASSPTWSVCPTAVKHTRVASYARSIAVWRLL